MATLLYQELEIDANAPTEQIRKAYKKKALQTHPDRLPPNATSAQKSAAEENFRKVNNAYEVLADPAKRREYDLHGVWPPPEVEEIMQASTSRPSSYGHHHSHQSPFGRQFTDPFLPHHHNPFPSFTDPFMLFESMFSDFPSPRSSPFHRHNRFNPALFNVDPFDQHFDGDLRTAMDPFMGFGPSRFALSLPSHGFLPSPHHFAAHPQTSQDNCNGSGRWMSESYMTQSINGVTQTIRKRRDWDGNEHETRTYSDGREIHTINGVEQNPAQHGRLPSGPDNAQRRTQTMLPPSHPVDVRLLPSDSQGGPPPPYVGPSSGSGNYHNASTPRLSAEGRSHHAHGRDRRQSHHGLHRRPSSTNSSEDRLHGEDRTHRNGVYSTRQPQ